MVPQLTEALQRQAQSRFRILQDRVEPRIWMKKADHRQIEMVRQPLRLQRDDCIEVVVQQQPRGGPLFHVVVEEGEERPVATADDFGVQRRYQLRPIEVVGVGKRHTDRVRAPPAQVRGRPVQPESGRGRLLPDPLRQFRANPPLVPVVQHQRNRGL